MRKNCRMNKICFNVGEEDILKRIDSYLTSELEGFSRSFLQKCLKQGLVNVNGKTVKANYKLKADDFIEIEIPPEEEPDIKAEDIPLDIIYEDEDLLIVNKPKDMVVHPANLVVGFHFVDLGQLFGIQYAVADSQSFLQIEQGYVFFAFAAIIVG